MLPEWVLKVPVDSMSETSAQIPDHSVAEWSRAFVVLSCYADQYQDLQIVTPSSLDCPLVIVPIFSRRVDKTLWICISMDRVCTLLHACLVHLFFQTGCEYEDEFLENGDDAV